MYTKNDFGWVITQDSVFVEFKGESATILADDPAYNRIVNAIKTEDWDSLPAILSPKMAIVELSENRLHVDGSQVYLKEEDGAEWPVPGELNDCILRHVHENLPLGGLVNFAFNLRKNPTRRSVHQLFPWLESAKLTITNDGCFLAFKRIKHDWTDCHTGTVLNKPGCVIETDRSQVDDDPARHCSHGFHVCSWDYLRSFSGERIVQVKVNPADVVAVPEDYNNTKMRVCKYEVMKEVDSSAHAAAPSLSPLYQEDAETDAETVAESTERV